ncbi:hypothetical protein SAMN04489760_11260 [Syntrophus gentianae]|uniref:Patatin-like phospholipase n=1 Tax=Syntrophus gentianae TaxID=43775 RepID=A0A1H7XV12_9BACT|nr:hypothetical protein [Syntrophus gentianae]SEM37716.1 hypothetical protein SAMN04489760_11260 [Syntrophus gentianae]
MNSIRIKAGRKTYELIRDGGFSLDRISTFFAPAAGPRWLVATGFDLTLLRTGLLGRKRPVHLIGSSSGAWRFAAWLQPEAEKSYQNLMDAYIRMSFRRGDSAQSVLKQLIEVVNAYIEDDALPFALASKQYRLAVVTSRARHLIASETLWIQSSGLAICFLLNALSRSRLNSFLDRVVFFSGPTRPRFCLHRPFRGSFVPLNEVNFKQAVLASGAVPLAVAGIRDIYGAPRGVYRDGGLLDYHQNHDYTGRDDEVTLFFHYQDRIIPGWFDKRLKYRKTPDDVLDHTLLVFPNEEFVRHLPLGKIPDREDFRTFIDEPLSRIRNWQETVKRSEPLGEQFLELVESGKLKEVVERL